MESLSRRDALRIGAAAFAMAPISAAAIAAMPVSTTATKPKDDANLLALIAGVPAALDRHDEARRACCEAYKRALAEPGVPCPTLRSIQEGLRSIQEEYAARGITLTETQARGIGNERLDRASRKRGLDPAVYRMNAVRGQFRAVVRRIYAMRAHTLDGIAAKQRLAVMLNERRASIETYAPEAWPVSVLRDLLRPKGIETYGPEGWAVSVLRDLEQIAGRA